MRPMGATTTQTTAQTAPHHLRLAAFWAALGGLGAAAVLPYALALNPSVAARVPLPWPALAAAQGVQAGLLLLPLCWSGLRLGQPLGLDSPLARALVYHRPSPGVSRRGALAALATGIVGGGAVMLLDRVFAPLMPPAPQLGVSRIPLWLGTGPGRRPTWARRSSACPESRCGSGRLPCSTAVSQRSCCCACFS